MNELGAEDLGKMSEKDEAMMQVGGQVENKEQSLTQQETRGRSFLEKAKDRLGKINKDDAMHVMGGLATAGLIAGGLAEYIYAGTSETLAKIPELRNAIGFEATGAIIAGVIGMHAVARASNAERSRSNITNSETK